MRAFLIGSMREIHEPEGRGAFVKAAEALGAALAARGHEIVVCSAHPDTLDRNAITGANTAKRRSIVHLFRPDTRSMRHDPEHDVLEYMDVAGYPGLEFRLSESGGGWRNVHLSAMRFSDIVIGMGGTWFGTGSVLYSAQALGKPVLILPTFGGACEEAWDDFQPNYSEQQRTNMKSRPSDYPSWAAAITDLAEQLRRRNPFSQDNLGHHVLRLALLLASILLLLYLFVDGTSLPPAWLSVFLILFLSSLAGTTFRASLQAFRLMDAPRSNEGLVSELLLALGIATALVLIPQGMGFILYDQPPQVGTISEIRRVGGAFAVAAFFSALYGERFLEKLKALF
jgi:hypothetical protein